MIVYLLYKQELGEQTGTPNSLMGENNISITTLLINLQGSVKVNTLCLKSNHTHCRKNELLAESYY